MGRSRATRSVSLPETPSKFTNQPGMNTKIRIRKDALQHERGLEICAPTRPFPFLKGLNLRM